MITFPKPTVIPKGWGQEVVLFDCPDYTLKYLDFDEGKEGSFHFHGDKHESWCILSGIILLTYTDPSNGDLRNKELYEGDLIDIPRLMPHKVRAIMNTRIAEVSTPHRDTDTYRIGKGDGQRE